ncbi:GAF domain-containing protein [Chloroflexi bacterium TSY]|nr:GAF domain-containing protein [Chloroflexi bacterium TSY]
MIESQLRVLLIADAQNPLASQLNHLKIQSCYNVRVADTQKALCSLIESKNEQFDVAIIAQNRRTETDQQPQNFGIAFLQKVRALCPYLECIFFTDDEQPELGLDALRSGASHYLTGSSPPDEFTILLKKAAEHSRIHRERDLLSDALKISQSITSQLSLMQSLKGIVDAVVQLTGADICTVVLVNPITRKTIKVHSTQSQERNVRWTHHYQNRLLTRDILESDQGHWVSNIDQEGEIDQNFRQTGIKSFVVLPIPGKTKSLGVLYAYSFQNDAFSNHAFRVLERVAEQAGIAIKNSHLFEETVLERDRSEWMASQLMALYEIAHKMQSELRLPELLNTISRLAVQLLKADSGGILLLDESTESLGFAGAYGLGQQIIQGTRDVLGTSIAGRVAKTGKAFVANDVPNHPYFFNPAADGEGLLAIMSTPLRIGGKIIGTLDVHSKTDPLAFNEDGLKILSLLGNQAAIAIANARLVSQLEEQKDHWKRLVSSSPNGVISIDRDGTITSINDKAKSILNYHDNQLIHQSIYLFYCEKREARKIGKLLHESPTGTIVGYETFVRNADGVQIPIRLSATRLYDSQQRQIGSVGYFEDIRVIQENEKRLRLLLRASSVIAKASDLSSALHNLAELLVTYLDMTFCRLFLYNDHLKALTTEAVFPSANSSQLNWEPGLGREILLAEWAGLENFLRAGDPIVLRQDEDKSQPFLDDLALRLKLTEEIQSLLLIPIRTTDKVVGLLGLGEIASSGNCGISIAKQELAAAVGNQTAVLIERLQLQEIAQSDRERLRLFYEASNRFVSTQNPHQVLQDIVEHAKAATGASWVSVILIDHSGEAQGLVSTGVQKNFDFRQVYHAKGISAQVARNGEVIVIESVEKAGDRITSSIFWNNVGAALCLPLSLYDQCIGVMWVHYPQERTFPKSEIEAIQLYANQAAVAYDASQRMDTLERIRQGATDITSFSDLNDVLKQIAESACRVFQAHAAIFLSYDSDRDRFVLDECESIHLSSTLWEEFCIAVNFDECGTAKQIMNLGWYSVGNLNAIAEDRIIKSTTLAFLRRFNSQSFQAVVLTAEREAHGVLYLMYRTQHSFTEQDKQTAHTFANHAALALRKAKLHAQIRDARDTAQIVAKVTALEDDLYSTLQSVADGTRNVLGCDAVTLYEYNPDTDKIGPIPVLLGLRYNERVSRSPNVQKDSFVNEMLQRDEPYIVNDIGQDSRFGATRFAQEEQIQSCIAIPLKVGQDRVGVMFVNFRRPHHFTADELINIELFANQAAVAIRNAQLYHQVQRRAKALGTLYTASRAMTSSLALDKILATLAEQA